MMIHYWWFYKQEIRDEAVYHSLSMLFILITFITYLWSILFIARQRKISKLKTDFINNMTHEFKTPITTISIAADSIITDEIIKNEERVRYYANMIKKENLRMNEQVDRILQVARLDRKELDFKFRIVNAHEMIEEAIQGIIIQIDKRGGKIEKRLNANNPIITTDPIHFINIVNNLLDNANKYSPEAPQISIYTTSDNKGFFMTVQDKGIGMNKKIQTKIFDRFYRISSGLMPFTTGFGIGLSYIKAILKINEGSIRVKSEPGKGSQFTVFIPHFIRGKSVFENSQ